MFSWKDIKNPAAGGAEVMTWVILKSLAARGHEVCLFTSRYKMETPAKETLEGVEVVRAGGRYGVYFWAVYNYFRFFRGKFDLIIDQVNTVPFFTPIFVRERRLAFFPQLARQVWFFETRFPISLIGFLLEPLFLLFYKKTKVITISPSSQKDLQRFGLKQVLVTPVVADIKPLELLPPKPEGFDLAFVGRLVPSKKASEAIKAFRLLKAELPQAKLYVVGRAVSGHFRRLQELVSSLALSQSVVFLTKADNNQRDEILQRAHLLLVPSTKEGWGLVVTEANSQGTPAIVYNVEGLRDSVIGGQTGLICSLNKPQEMARLALKLYRDKGLYEKLRRGAWQFSKSFTKEKTVTEFLKIIESTST